MANKNDGSSIAQQIGTVSAGLAYNVAFDAKIPTGTVLEAGLFYNDGANWVALASPTTTNRMATRGRPTGSVSAPWRVSPTSGRQSRLGVAHRRH